MHPGRTQEDDRMRLRFVVLVISLVVGLPVDRAPAVTIDLVTVGNPGNPADAFGQGDVAERYGIGRTEVTNSEYV